MRLRNCIPCVLGGGVRGALRVLARFDEDEDPLGSPSSAASSSRDRLCSLLREDPLLSSRGHGEVEPTDCERTRGGGGGGGGGMPSSSA